MPYIPRADRGKFEASVQDLANDIRTDGELNYVISLLLIRVLKKSTVTYSRLNGIIGVLECAKLEFSRRHVDEYEDAKRLQNGDVR